jgi:hypothetical protein
VLKFFVAGFYSLERMDRSRQNSQRIDTPVRIIRRR